jgi:Ca2+/H+ antiporter
MADANIGPLLSSVSVMLAAYGFFYNTQRDRIDAVIAEERRDDANERRTQRENAEKVRTSTCVLAGVALLVWALLMPELVASVSDAFDPSFDLADYSTPHAIFFVAAMAWLLVALFVGKRACDVNDKVKDLKG